MYYNIIRVPAVLFTNCNGFLHHSTAQSFIAVILSFYIVLKEMQSQASIKAISIVPERALAYNGQCLDVGFVLSASYATLVSLAHQYFGLLVNVQQPGPGLCILSEVFQFQIWTRMDHTFMYLTTGYPVHVEV